MKVIVNADDFGMSETVNEAILNGFNTGLLTSTCIMSNMPGFQDAASKLSQCENIGLGVHLNIIEGKSVNPDPKPDSLIYDSDGYFNNGFLSLLLKSNNDVFLRQVEEEFEMQIEKVLQYKKPLCLDSHVHTHAIPKIFDITCRLAQKYDIPSVRTQFEIPYCLPGNNKFSDLKYYVNLIKVALLDSFTLINRKTLRKYDLETNDYVIGVGYTGIMDISTIECGINSLRHTDKILEVICHPDTNSSRQSNYTEYMTVMNPDLKNRLSGIEFVNSRLR